MERQRQQRQRPSGAHETRRRDQRSAWPSGTLIAGGAALGIFTLAGLLAYRYLWTKKAPKKARSKHSKKDRKSKKQEVEEEEPELRKSGTTSPRGPSRPASPVAPVKSVPYSSRQDQFAWWKEIAADQFEARKTEHAQYYAKKALDLASSIPFIQETTSYQQLRFIMVTGVQEPEARMKELQSIREALNRISSTEAEMKEYHLLKGRVLATLSDSMVRRQLWAEAEAVCEETIESMKKGFEGQDAMLFTNLAIQYYQLAGVQRGLKAYEKAAESSKIAYEHVVKSKLQPEFWSQVARQRADLLDALDRFEEAKTVMAEHLERIEAHHEIVSAEVASKLAKQKAKNEKLLAGQMDANEDDEDDEDDIDEDATSQTQQTANQKHVNNVADNCMFLGRLHFERGYYAEAITYLEKAHGLHPNYHYLSILAGAQFESGLNTEAVATQAKLKELRPMGEMPISTSRTMLTKTHYLRQAKRDGAWVFAITVENKTLTPLSEEHRLPVGSYIEAFVRRFYSPDEAIESTAGALKNRSLGPYTYTVTGEEKDSILKINGILSEKLENGKVYEIVLFAYSSAEDKSNRIATHRQLARASDINNVFRNSMLSGAPFSQEELEEDLDDYAQIDASAATSALIEATTEDGETTEEINADAHAVASAPSSSSVHVTADAVEEIEPIVAAVAETVAEVVAEESAEHKAEETPIVEPTVKAVTEVVAEVVAAAEAAAETAVPTTVETVEETVETVETVEETVETVETVGLEEAVVEKEDEKKVEEAVDPIAEVIAEEEKKADGAVIDEPIEEEEIVAAEESVAASTEESTPEEEETVAESSEKTEEQVEEASE